MDRETELIEDSRAGSADAFCELVRLNQTRVRSYIARYIRPKDAADDIAQEVFLAGHQNLAKYRGDVPFRLWLLGIARRRIVDYLRTEGHRQRRQMRERDVWDELDAWQTELADAGELRLPRHELELVALEGCLNKLSRENAELIESYYLKSMTSAEIARGSGKTESAVRMSLLRLRQALRICLQAQLVRRGEE